MLRKLIAVLGTLSFVSCTPATANAVGLEVTHENCTIAKTMARQILTDFKQGASQIDVMRDLNSRPMKDFGPNGETVKVYLQVNVSALHRNVAKAYSPASILNVIERDCMSQLGKKL